MSKLADIRALRGLSQSELAKRVGTTQSQIAKLETGNRKMSFNWAIRIAAQLDVKPEALLIKDEQIALLAQITDLPGAPRPAPSGVPTLTVVPATNQGETIPVYTFTTACPPVQGRFPIQVDPISTTPTPPCLKGVEGAYGLRVADTRMAPRFIPRQLLHVDPRRTPIPEIGVLVRLHDGTACVRAWGGWSDDGNLFLIGYQPAESITVPGDNVAAIHVIVGLQECL